MKTLKNLAKCRIRLTSVMQVYPNGNKGTVVARSGLNLVDYFSMKHWIKLDFFGETNLIPV